MSPATRFLSAAALSASLAAAAVLELPVVIQNGYKLVEVQIGTPPTPHHLLFDTGSTSSWVVESTCANTTCKNGSGYPRNGYDPADSSTANATGASAYIPYLGGTIAGNTITDVWSAGGVTWEQDVIAANSSTWSALAADGFLGMGFSSIADGGAMPVVETLMAQGQLDEAKIGIFYGDPNAEGPSGGVVTIGASHEDKYVEGDLTKVGITRIWPTYYDVWRSMIQSTTGTRTTANGTVVSTPVDFQFGSVVFDTGASSISLPPAQNELVYQSIGWNWTALITGAHIPLCSEFNSSWSVSFTFDYSSSPKVVTLRGDQLRRPGFAYRDDACWPPFDDGGAPGFTLIGTSFLRNFYTVWDYGSKANESDIANFSPTLGFGALKEEYDYVK